MFQFHMLNNLKQKVNNFQTKYFQSKEQWQETRNRQLQQGSNLEYVTNTEGYKDAFSHFEDLINSMYREREVNFDYIKGIEAVFQYFEMGKEIKRKAEAELNEFKDEA